MKRVFVVLLVVACVIALEGLRKLKLGSDLPVYTNPAALEELSDKLENLPGAQRSERWYRELPRYETAHKSLTDTGRGLISLAVAILLGVLFLYLSGRTGGRQRGLLVWVYWTFLWGIKVPLSMWYYVLRYQRRDYPVWGDSFVIGVTQEWIAWGVGFAVFTILLCILMIRYQFPCSILISRPQGRRGWTRAIILWLWIALLLLCGLPAIGDGDEGGVISCIGALPVILLALAGIRRSSGEIVLPAPALPADCKT